jgi:hypothetical protein
MAIEPSTPTLASGKLPFRSVVLGCARMHSGAARLEQECNEESVRQRTEAHAREPDWTGVRVIGAQPEGSIEAATGAACDVEGTCSRRFPAIAQASCAANLVSRI